MPRSHKKPAIELPPYYFSEKSPCVQSVIEDAFTAKALAETLGAPGKPQCQELLRAAEKSLKVLANKTVTEGRRCAAGDRAARKFWEAKACARR